MEEILRKIREVYKELPDKDKAGVSRIVVEGQDLGSSRDSQRSLRAMVIALRGLAGKKGTFEVVRIVQGTSAGTLAGLEEDVLLPHWDELAEHDFIVPADVEDPYEEFGPCFVILLKDGIKSSLTEQQAYREIHKMFETLSPDAKRLFATDIWHTTELLDDDEEERDRILKKFNSAEGTQ